MNFTAFSSRGRGEIGKDGNLLQTIRGDGGMVAAVVDCEAVLFVPEFSIQAAMGEEFGVVALFADSAGVEDEDAVGVDDGGEAMSDGQDGAAFGEAFEGLIDRGFGCGIEGRSGFVEDKNFGLAENGAGEGDALALAAGEFSAAACADPGVS